MDNKNREPNDDELSDDELTPEEEEWGRRIGEMCRESDDEALRISAPAVAQALLVWEQLDEAGRKDGESKK